MSAADVSTTTSDGANTTAGTADQSKVKKIINNKCVNNINITKNEREFEEVHQEIKKTVGGKGLRHHQQIYQHRPYIQRIKN